MPGLVTDLDNQPVAVHGGFTALVPRRLTERRASREIGLHCLPGPRRPGITSSGGLSVSSDVRTADPALDGGYGTDVAGLPAREPRRVRMFGWTEGGCLSFSFRAGRTGRPALIAVVPAAARSQERSGGRGRLGETRRR